MNARRPLIAVVALVSLLLWGQYAIAQHAVEHLSHDSIEVCEGFQHSEKSTGFTFISPQFRTPQLDSDFFLSSQKEFDCASAELRSARAPPSIS